MSKNVGIDLPVDVIRWENFDGWKPSEVRIWFTEHMKDIYPYTFQKLRDAMANTPAPNPFPDYVADYCSREEYQNALTVVAFRSVRPARFLPCVVAIAVAHNASCQDILFRVPAKATLSQSVSRFLELMMQSNEIERNLIVQSLKSNYEPIHDIQHVLKCRLMELADEQGVDFREMVASTVNLNCYCRNTGNAFAADISTVWKPAVNGIKESQPDQLNDYTMTMGVYSLCSMYHVSADRLLLRDYSRYACHSDGRDLTDKERDYASLFMSADFRVQAQVLNQLYLFRTHFLQKPLDLTS